VETNVSKTQDSIPKTFNPDEFQENFQFVAQKQMMILKSNKK